MGTSPLSSAALQRLWSHLLMFTPCSCLTDKPMLGSPVSSQSGLLVHKALTLLLCSPLCNSSLSTFTLSGPLTCVHRYGIRVQPPMLCPGQAWRSSCCVLWCMSLGPTLPLRLMSWGPAASCKAFSGEPASAGRSLSSSRYTPFSRICMMLGATAASLSHSCNLSSSCICVWSLENDKKKTRKATPFGSNEMRSQVLYWAAQDVWSLLFC